MGERKLIGHTDVLDARQHAEFLNQALIESNLLFDRAIFLLRQIQAKAQNAFVAETRIDSLKLMKSSQHQASANEQQ